MYITTSTEKRIRYSVTMRTIQYGIMNSAMGHTMFHRTYFLFNHNFFVHVMSPVNVILLFLTTEKVPYSYNTMQYIYMRSEADEMVSII